MIDIVPASRWMVDSLLERPLPRTVKAIAAVDGEKVLGVAGVYLIDGKQVMWASFTDELRSKPRVLVKGWRILRDMVNRDIPVYALAAPEIAKSAEYLEHLGFSAHRGRTYKWQTL